MKKNIFILILIMLISLVPLSGCEGNEADPFEEKAPEYLRVDFTILKWGELGGAEKYEVEINYSQKEEVSTNSFDISDIVEPNSYTFRVRGIKGTLKSPWSSPFVYSIVPEVRINQSAGGTVSGEGRYHADDSVEVSASYEKGYKFDGWYQNGEKLSVELKYNFTMPNQMVYLTAVFTLVEVNEKEEFSGSGTVSSPYLISNYKQLAYFSQLVNTVPNYSKNMYFALANDINYQGYEFIPIGFSHVEEFVYDYAFSGNFDGCNYTISNFELSSAWSDKEQIGLFGYLYNGSISNLILSNFSINVASLEGTYLGPIVGYNQGGSITNCHVVGDINENTSFGSLSIGGIVGFNQGTVSNCSYTGDINVQTTVDYIFVGGIVGDNQGGLINIASYGSLATTSLTLIFSGGLVGRSNGGYIKYGFSSMELTSLCNAWIRSGGIVGYADGTNLNGLVYVGNISATAKNYCSVAMVVGLQSKCTYANIYHWDESSSYRSENQEDDLPLSNVLASALTTSEIQKPSFYGSIGITNSEWNLSEINITNGSYPTLR